MKQYYIQENIGTAKYVVSYHDGVKTHKDGSPFYDIAIYKSSQAMYVFVNKLRSNGYTYKDN